jgi:hypothetical protein
MAVRGGVMRRGTSNRNERGSTQTRRRRREWLVATWRADVDLPDWHAAQHGATEVPLGAGIPACRCYRCGVLLTVEMVTADRIKPGCQGGTYVRTNIRPACGACNSITGGATRGPLTSGKGKDMVHLRFRTNGRRRAAREGAAVTAPAVPDRKAAPCGECGARPGFACNSLTSVRQVSQGREGAYLKPLTSLHRSRGR